jgi:hypothetical protein
MTGLLARERRAAAAWTAVLAIVFAIAAWLIVGWDAAKLRPPPAIGLVAPDFAANPGKAQAIIVATREGSYRIAKTPKGWTMADRGAYPIKADRMRDFTDALAQLSAVRPLTRDPKKHERLGVDDPTKGGQGVRLQVQDAQGALLANLVVSASTDRQYLRRNADPQVWAASTAIPNLRQASAWLDLTPFQIAPERIARVDVAPATGNPYALVRPSPDTPIFQVARPVAGKPLANGARPDAVAAALGALQPVDVAPAPTITGAPTARVVLATTGGLAVDAELFVRGALYWVKLGARASNPGVEPQAQALNARVGPWAYSLTETDFGLLAPALADANPALVVAAPFSQSAPPSAAVLPIGASPAKPPPPKPAAPKPAPRPSPPEPAPPASEQTPAEPAPEPAPTP